MQKQGKLWTGLREKAIVAGRGVERRRKYSIFNIQHSTFNIQLYASHRPITISR
jgi:hypothetical protein